MNKLLIVIVILLVAYFVFYDKKKPAIDTDFEYKIDSVADIAYKKKLLDDSLFLKQNSFSYSIAEFKEVCNQKVLHIVLKHAINADTLRRFTSLITDSIFSAVPYREGCMKKLPIGGVFVYFSDKSYRIGKWRSKGIRLTGNAPSIDIMPE